jgi:hypothetical protein
MNHESAFHRLALYVGQSDVALGLWICAIAIVIIAGVGWACVCVAAGTVEEDGTK